MARAMDVRLIEGNEAEALLADPGFIEAWNALHRACPWARVFQRAEFAKCWFANYGRTFVPLAVVGTDERGKLAGLLILASDAERLVHVGAHQAEYQVWLALDESGSRRFLAAAVAGLRERFPRGSLKLRYLPSRTPRSALQQGAVARFCEWREHRQPLIDLERAEQLAESLRKKSNKSRLKRLAQAAGAEPEAVAIASADELERWIDRIAADYDQRQGETNAVRPFAEDPAKRQFHLDLARAGLLHCFLYRAGDTLLAAILSMRDGDRLAVAIFAHSPRFDQHSPGKFAMYRLGLLAAEAGYGAIDLTPGGAWKERFASDWDDLAEVTIHFSAAAAWRSRLRERTKRWLKRLLGRR